MIISSILVILILISIPIAPFLDIRAQGIVSIVALLLLVIVGIYLFAGLAKIIVYAIYGIFTGLFLIFLPEGYQLPFIIIGTLLCVLNPLAGFESFLEKKLNEEDVLPIRFSLRGSYWPFYTYRKEMKHYYHLPQARKMYTKKWYLTLRQISTILVFSIGIFLFIYHINHIANSLDNFDILNFFTFYNVTIMFILTYFLHRKGFTSTFRTLVVSLFPTLIYVVLISNLDATFRFGIAGALFLLGVSVSIYELIQLYQRVVYEAYHYYDVDQQKDVYANALFEPLVYNESFIWDAEYQIKVKLETFQKQFKDILVYANYFRFIITAYTYGKQMIHLHAHFHEKDTKRIQLFKTYLEAKFKMAIPLIVENDPNKVIYEKQFFHRPGYIIARTQSLAGLLKELEIETKIIISLIAYFENEEDLRMFAAEYKTNVLPDLSDEDTITVRIDIECHNVDYVIESKIGDALLSLLIHHGKYVRVSVYY